MSPFLSPNRERCAGIPFLTVFAGRVLNSNPSFSVQEKKFLQSRGFFSCIERGVTRAPVRRVAGALRRCRVKDEGGALRASHAGALSERKSTGRRASLEAGRVQIPGLSPFDACCASVTRNEPAFATSLRFVAHTVCRHMSLQKDSSL